MAKELDNKKMWEALLDYINMINHNEMPYMFLDALNEQGLDYKDGKIVDVQKHVKTAIEAWKEMRLEVYAQASGNRHEPNYSDDNTKIFSLNDIDEIFEKISDSAVEKKSVEWSEEDEKMLKSIISDYDDMVNESEGFAPLCNKRNWLKSLRSQSHWKPSKDNYLR